MSKLRDLLQALGYPNPAANRRYFRCRCPVRTHGKMLGDRNPSLTVTPAEDRLLLHCQVDCPTDDVLDAIGFTYDDLFTTDGHQSGGGQHREPDPATLEEVQRLETWWWSVRWQNLTDRDVYLALIWYAYQHGRLDSAGIRFKLDHRTLTLAAAVSRRRVIDSVKRLRMARAIFTPNAQKFWWEAETFLLPRAIASPFGLNTRGLYTNGDAVARSLPPRQRVPTEQPGALVKSMGKPACAALDYLIARSGYATAAELGSDLGMKRPRDARKHLKKLVQAGIVEVSGEEVILAEDYERWLADHMEHSGQNKQHRLDVAQNRRERLARWDSEQRPAVPEPEPDIPDNVVKFPSSRSNGRQEEAG